MPPSGTIRIAPESSTDYVLVVQKGTQIAFARVKVRVTGTKGAADFPDLDAFRGTGGRWGRRQGISYTDLLALVQDLFVAQGFGVRGYFLPTDPSSLLYTDKMRDPNLVTDEDTGIRYRRAAYGVEVYHPSGDDPKAPVTFKVTATMDFQRLAEAKWRPEKDPAVIRRAEESVLREIEGSALPKTKQR